MWPWAQDVLFFFHTSHVNDFAVKGEELCIEDAEGGDYSPDNCTASEAANTDLMVNFLILLHHQHKKTTIV